MPNLFAKVRHDLAEELFTTLAASDRVRIERIVSRGQASPPDFWFDQPQREWVVVVAGEARLRFEDEPTSRTLRPGDYVDIAAHRRHRVEWTTPDGPTIWLAVHFENG